VRVFFDTTDSVASSSEVSIYIYMCVCVCVHEVLDAEDGGSDHPLNLSRICQ